MNFSFFGANKRFHKRCNEISLRNTEIPGGVDESLQKHLLPGGGVSIDSPTHL